MARFSFVFLMFLFVGCSSTGGGITPEELCGNGALDEGETCDGTDLGGKTCITQGFASGTLACTATCRFDTTGCETPPVENCTNGIDDDGDGDIDCDDTDCADAPACQAEDCGNGSIETGEHCDGANLNGKTCETQGFAGGTLACTDACRFDTTGCNPVEDCDNGVDDDGDGDVDCDDVDCVDDTDCEVGEDCGNGIIDSGESCDGSNHGAQTCATLGFTGGGTLVCTAACHFSTSGCEMAGSEICTDGIDNDGNGAVDCADDACFGHTACEGVVCGDGVADEGEVCDGTDLNGRTCVSLGYAGGTLACTASCLLSTAGCTGVPPVCGNAVCETGETEASCPADCGGGAICGNGLLNPGENCDGSNLGGNTCVSLGYTRGTLSCNSACQLNTAGCTRCGNGTCESGEDYNSCPADCPQPVLCGNGIVEGTEPCDGSNLNGQSCVSRGYAGGTLACNNTCTGFVTAGCSNSTGETICNDGLDNDGDGQIDAQDPDCGTSSGVEQNCSDGIDNDSDGYVDCWDYDCVAADVCRPVSQRGVNSYFVCLPGQNTTEFGCVCSDDLTNWSNHHATGRVCMGNALKGGVYEIAWSQGGCSPSEILRHMDADGVRDFSVLRFKYVSNVYGSADNMALYVGCSVNPGTGLQTQANMLVLENRYDAAQQAIRNQLFPGGMWTQVAIGAVAEDELSWWSTFYPR